MALDKIAVTPDLTKSLEGAAAGWDLRRSEHVGKAAAIRDDAIDHAARMIIADPARRKTVLGMHYRESEMRAAAEEERAQRFANRARVAREQGAFLSDGDHLHDAKHGELLKEATDAGRVLHDKFSPALPAGIGNKPPKEGSQAQVCENLR
jgi:hypothetical protein